MLFAVLLCAAHNFAPKTVTVTGVLKSANCVGGWHEKEYDFVFEDGTHCRVFNDNYPLYIGHKIRIKYILTNGYLTEVDNLDEGQK